MIDFENMTLAQTREYCSKWSHEHGYPCEETGCELRRRHICRDWVHEWDFDRLTPQEFEICKALGAKWVSTDAEYPDIVSLWKSKPMVEDGDHYNSRFYPKDGLKSEWISHINSELFPSVKPGDCIDVEELLK